MIKLWVPTGFRLNFFKAFEAKFIPILDSVYLESLSLGSLPPTLRQASISVLPRKDKDPGICTSYRPISLMNVDAKILAKALACRLERVPPNNHFQGADLLYKGAQALL